MGAFTCWDGGGESQGTEWGFLCFCWAAPGAPAALRPTSRVYLCLHKKPSSGSCKGSNAYYQKTVIVSPVAPKIPEEEWGRRYFSFALKIAVIVAGPGRRSTSSCVTHCRDCALIHLGSKRLSVPSQRGSGFWQHRFLPLNLPPLAFYILLLLLSVPVPPCPSPLPAQGSGSPGAGGAAALERTGSWGRPCREATNQPGAGRHSHRRHPQTSLLPQQQKMNWVGGSRWVKLLQGFPQCLRADAASPRRLGAAVARVTAPGTPHRKAGPRGVFQAWCPLTDQQAAACVAVPVSPLKPEGVSRHRQVPTPGTEGGAGAWCLSADWGWVRLSRLGPSSRRTDGSDWRLGKRVYSCWGSPK